MTQNNQEDLSQYKTRGLSLLQLMGLVALIALVVGIVLHFYF